MSSSDIAISVSNISKCYQIYDSPRDRLKQFVVPRLHRIAGRVPKQHFREFWALKDVSFEVKKGETVGIIGRNGSGKSTLLQIICGTLYPTNGSIQTNGRIAALLELGSGFNPEFTGRENVYLNAAVLGLSRAEIESRFDDIVAFADIGDFVDQPVKTYSSGMMVRLAFAVAINVEPEILIVDEALSVGDELFQRKCFSRIETIRAGGATILFVSHSGAQIVELCDRAVLIDAGEKLAVGLPKQIVGNYQKLLYAPLDKRNEIRSQIRIEDTQQLTAAAKSNEAVANTPSALSLTPPQDLRENFDPNLKPTSSFDFESHGAIIGPPEILTLGGERVNGLVRGRKYRYCFRVDFNRMAKGVRFGMSIKSTTGFSIGGALSAHSLNEALPLVEAGKSINVEFAFTCHLNPGTYFMNAGVFGCTDNEETVLHRKVDAVAFRVLPVESNIETEMVSFGFEPDMFFL
jgi:lipopolysaccharide transport system ATP-binding protein